MFDLLNRTNYSFLTFQNIIWKNHIGKGASGDVYHCNYQSIDCVAKCFYLRDYHEESGWIRDVWDELNIYKELKGVSNLSSIIGYSYDSNNSYICIVMKYHSFINLEEYILSTENIDDSNRYQIMLQLSENLKEIHQRDVVHCDIKPQNILFKKGDCIFIDFGVSTIIKDQFNEIEESMGTEGYMSEELMYGYAYKKSDIYSLGVTFIELWDKDIWCRKENYRKDILFSLRKLEKNNKRLVKVLRNCISTDIKKRPTIDTLIKHLRNLS